MGGGGLGDLLIPGVGAARHGERAPLVVHALRLEARDEVEEVLLVVQQPGLVVRRRGHERRLHRGARGGGGSGGSGGAFLGRLLGRSTAFSSGPKISPKFGPRTSPTKQG